MTNDSLTNDLQKSINCPLCGEKANLCSNEVNLRFKGNPYLVTKYFYRCEKCKEDFTTTESDTLTLHEIQSKI